MINMIMNNMLVNTIGGLSMVYYSRRFSKYLLNKYNKTNNSDENNNLDNHHVEFNVIDGAIYLGLMALYSKYNNVNLYDKAIHTLAIYGIISIIPYNDDEETYDGGLDKITN